MGTINHEKENDTNPQTIKLYEKLAFISHDVKGLFDACNVY